MPKGKVRKVSKKRVSKKRGKRISHKKKVIKGCKRVTSKKGKSKKSKNKKSTNIKKKIKKIKVIGGELEPKETETTCYNFITNEYVPITTDIENSISFDSLENRKCLTNGIDYINCASISDMVEKQGYNIPCNQIFPELEQVNNSDCLSGLKTVCGIELKEIEPTTYSIDTERIDLAILKSNYDNTVIKINNIVETKKKTSKNLIEYLTLLKEIVEYMESEGVLTILNKASNVNETMHRLVTEFLKSKSKERSFHATDRIHYVINNLFDLLSNGTDKIIETFIDLINSKSIKDMCIDGQLDKIMDVITQ